MIRPNERLEVTVFVLAACDALRDRLVGLLGGEGYRVQAPAPGTVELASLGEIDADVVILDVAMTSPPALDACRAVHDGTGCPVLLVSTSPSKVDLVACFEAGADDYLEQADRDRELVARVHTLLRRRRRRRSRPGAAIVLGEVTMDLDAHSVSVRGREVVLAPREFSLLELLLQNAGMVISKARIVDALWGGELDSTSNTLGVHVSRLRVKIEEDPSHPSHILTVRGIGYRYRS